ncbi:MAG: ATP-binding protein [Pirellulaceae bacterium]
MTRLFLRFYLGVVLILIIAWMILGYVFRERSDSKNIRVVEEALSGGARLSRQQFEAAPRDEWPKVLQSLQKEFDYPVEIVRLEDHSLRAELKDRLLRGDVVLHASRIKIALPDNEFLLYFGPLPQFVGPSRAEVFIGVGFILTLAAAAIAILLRPVAMQLRAVERTATAITGGDLSARIDQTAVKRTLPLAIAFNSMADRTEDLLKRQRELLQAVSHELRTPLARIRFAADLIESATDDQTRKARLESVDTATQQLDDLVGELLTYVRIDSEASSTQYEEINSHELLSDVIQTYAPLNPRFQFSIAPESQEFDFYSDGTSLQRAIGNLVANAARYACQSVQLSTHREADSITIHVNDDGPGIAEEDRQRIFEPFVRLDPSDSEGTGLGLALVNRIITSLSGSVRVEDSAPHGARFIVELPAMSR